MTVGQRSRILIPEARDGFPLKIFAHRMGRAVLDAARQDPHHPHHAEAIEPDTFPYLTDELTLVSKDGLHLHTLRKDGMTYLRSQAGWGSFTSEPLVLFEPRRWVNLLAPQGEAQFHY